MSNNNYNNNDNVCCTTSCGNNNSNNVGHSYPPPLSQQHQQQPQPALPPPYPPYVPPSQQQPLPSSYSPANNNGDGSAVVQQGYYPQQQQQPIVVGTPIGQQQQQQQQQQPSQVHVHVGSTSRMFSTGLCDFFEHPLSCLDACVCPCCTVAYQYGRLTTGRYGMDTMVCCTVFCMDVLCFWGLVTVCATVNNRMRMRELFMIGGNGCEDCLMACCCLPCTISQISREMGNRSLWPGGVISGPNYVPRVTIDRTASNNFTPPSPYPVQQEQMQSSGNTPPPPPQQQQLPTNNVNKNNNYHRAGSSANLITADMHIPEGFQSTFVDLSTLDQASLRRISQLVKSSRDRRKREAAEASRANAATDNAVGGDVCEDKDADQKDMFFEREYMERAVLHQEEDDDFAEVLALWEEYRYVVEPALERARREREHLAFEKKRLRRMQKLAVERECRAFWGCLEDARHKEAHCAEIERQERQAVATKNYVTKQLRKEFSGALPVMATPRPLAVSRGGTAFSPLTSVGGFRSHGDDAQDPTLAYEEFAAASRESYRRYCEQQRDISSPYMYSPGLHNNTQLAFLSSSDPSFIGSGDKMGVSSPPHHQFSVLPRRT
eukprot:PhM_4_TR18639/c1_g1_i4/m.79993